MADKKKAPKRPKPAKKPPAPPTTIPQEFFNGLVGRGIRPFSLWFSCVFLPLLALMYAGAAPVTFLAVFAMLWTVPLERVAYFLLGVGNLRECLADVLPHSGGLVPFLPGMLPVLLPNLWLLAPAAGPLAPYLKFLIKRPAFLAKALPMLVPRMELMLKYNMIELLGSNFERMDDLHYTKLEGILPDLMRDLPVLAPHFHVIAPYIVEICERADVLFPVVQLLLPHIEECEPHLWWLVPFADVPGFQEFLQYLDVLVPSIDEFAIYGPDLLPYIPKIRQQIPILVQNLDALLPMMGDAADHMDAVVYWLAAYMPVANSLGLLNKPMLLKAGTPVLPLLPNVPERHRTFCHPKPEELLLAAATSSSLQSGFSLPLARQDKHSGAWYFVLVVNSNSKVLGEWRYSTLLALHEQVVLPKLRRNPPPFPPKQWRGMDAGEVERRRQQLEQYLDEVLGNRAITCSPEFKAFLGSGWVASALQDELNKVL